MRATILEELNKDYVKGARARGVRGSVIIWKNVMKSSMLTIITLLALSIGSLLGGTTIVETIFYVGWCGEDGSRCYYYERLSDHSGICRMDGDYLRCCESYYGYHLSLPGSPRQIRG